MIIKKKAYFPSADGKTQIMYITWLSDLRPPRAVLQLVHGMVEFIDRYDDFARYMAARGWLVTGNDHLGHGDSVQSREDWGFFAASDGYALLTEDMEQLRTLTHAQNPDLPCFFLGHSMGSFLLRRYLCLYPEAADGAVIMGTAVYPKPVLRFARALCNHYVRKEGGRAHNPLLHKLVLGNNNKRIKGADSPNAWLSKDKAIVEAYDREPRNNFRFTNQAYSDLFDLLLSLSEKRALQKMTPSLPLLLVSGAEDPIGAYGKAVPRLARQYRRLGMEDVEEKLFAGDRHEILNETDRDAVYDFIRTGWRKS